MIAAALVAVTAGFIAGALNRRRVAHVCNAIALGLTAAYVLTGASDHTMRIIVGVLLYVGGIALLALVALIALWPICADLLERKDNDRP